MGSFVDACSGRFDVLSASSDIGTDQRSLTIAILFGLFFSIVSVVSVSTLDR